MKIKFIMTLGLAAAVGAAGAACKSAANTNAAMNTNIAVATATPVVKTTEAATTDPNLKSKIEAALKAKGLTDVTVDTTTTPASLRGSYPKAKLAEMMMAAQEANGGKPVQNQATAK